MDIRREYSPAIKGLSILLIVLHHFTQTFGFLPDFLRGVGPVACSAFFFISGYGLASNPSDKRKWIRRLLKLYLPFVIANILYILWFVYDGEIQSFSISIIILKILGVYLANEHCWFMQVLLLFYLTVFYVDVKQNNDKRKIIALTILVGGTFTIGTSQPGSMSWIAFPLGVLYKMISPPNVMCLKTRYLKLAIVFISIISWLCYYSIGEMLLNNALLIINFWIMCLTIPFLFLSISKYICNFNWLKFWGDRSIDVYLIHGLVLSVLGLVSIDGIWLFCVYSILVFLLSLLFGELRKRLFSTLSI